MPTFAAVDIGANSVRLKIARLTGRKLEVLHEDREVTRLGAPVFRSGLLSPQAMANTIKVLQRFHRATQDHGAELVRVVSTSPLRDARNASAFIDWVRSATGWRVEVISGLEEGRLIHLGVVSNLRVGRGNLLLIDLGGGSCELTTSREGQIERMFSLPLGAVRLTQEFLPHDPPKKKELERLQEYIQREISRIERKVLDHRTRVCIATSGTAAALAGLYSATHSKEQNSNLVPRSGVIRLTTTLAGYDLQQRTALRGIGPRRAEIIVAGTMVFSELLTRLKLPGFRYSELGLRDGLLDQMVADYDAGTRYRKQVESERQSALLAAARHFGVDLQFAARVKRLAIMLFHGMRKVHRLPAEYEEWLAAACMLQEVGSFINRAGRHRHTYYIIANSEIFGFTIQQRRIIAAVARYIGKSRPTPGDRIVRMVGFGDRDQIAKAVMLLRLARALDQSRRGAVQNLRVRVQSDRVILKLSTRRSGADLELWALEKERNYFRDVFGRELVPMLS
ncbi:MAG TPA: Ppx/GppA phosphatase family protein [Terriglobales bacterium]|nr:Ppx/GppA phosphatase family protein [Terriglobales bacterium]